MVAAICNSIGISHCRAVALAVRSISAMTATANRPAQTVQPKTAAKARAGSSGGQEQAQTHGAFRSRNSGWLNFGEVQLRAPPFLFLLRNNTAARISLAVCCRCRRCCFGWNCPCHGGGSGHSIAIASCRFDPDRGSGGLRCAELATAASASAKARLSLSRGGGSVGLRTRASVT